MAIDSTAELLFNITANSDDATENIARFRALMGQDLDGMAAQFSDWADETIGEIDSVNAAMTAGLAVIAAGILAAGVAIGEATKDYEKYADEVGHAMKMTGLSAETLSAMHSVAVKTGVSFDALTSGLVKFESSIVKASEGSKPQLAAFQALGISQKDVIAGQKDLLPLLEKVMDGFHSNASAVQKAALARDLFSRSGPELLAFLSKGSAYLKENAAEAEKLGLILSSKDVMAAREFKLAQKELAEEGEALAVTVGRHVVPMLEKFESAMIAGVAAAKSFGQGGLKAFQAPLVFLKEYAEEMTKIKKTVEAAGAQGDVTPLVSDGDIAKVKDAKEEFNGLATIVESMRSKIASQGSGWDRLREETEHYRVEIDKATAQLEKMHAAGKITPESYQAEKTALLQIPELLDRVVKDTTAKLGAADTQAWGEAISKSLDAADKLAEEQEKAGERRIEVSREVNDKLAENEEQSYALQRSRLIQQMNAWAAELAKKTALTAADWDAVDKITSEGLAKIDRTEATAFQQELVKLREDLDATVAANATAQDKLFLDEQKELEKYSAIEEQKTLLTAKSNQQRAQIEQMYAQIRAQILQKYQNDLQTLMNSQGFQGIFGNYFGSMIKQNQALFQQWSQSANQSVMLVKVSLEGLQEMASKAFQTMIQGLGQTIVQALVAGKSVTQAMEQMLKSTLASFAGQALTAAIMATGWGFYWLALQDYSAAGSAFTSAAIFGTIGAAAAIGAKYMPGGNAAGGGSGSGTGTGSRSGGGGGGYGSGGGGGNQAPNVYVNIAGHVIGPSGAAQLCDIINQAVYGNDTQLYASHNPQGVPL